MNPREAVVVPGGAYGPHAPLLMYAADAAEARRATIRTVHWQNREELNTLPEDQWGQWVVDQVADTMSAAAPPSVEMLLIAKSLGTHAAASAAVLGQVATAVEDFLDDVVWR